MVRWNWIVGVVLIVLGAITLMGIFHVFWPLLLIAVGVLVVVGATWRKGEALSANRPRSRWRARGGLRALPPRRRQAPHRRGLGSHGPALGQLRRRAGVDKTREGRLSAST